MKRAMRRTAAGLRAVTIHDNHGVRKICACPRSKWSKCDHGWHFSFKWKDTHYRFSLDKHLGKHVDSKSAAEDAGHEIRKAIKAGKFGQPVAREDMTLRQLADIYLERYVAVERSATAAAYRMALNTICATSIPRPSGGAAAFGEWRVGDIVTDTLERYREVRRASGTGIVGTNRHLGSLRALLNWGVRVGYLEQTPFKRATETVVKLSPEHGRSRRLDGEEETSLLAACGTHLRAVVECAIETGMRRGEILSLQWSQIEGLTIEHRPGKEPRLTWASKSEIVLPWTKTKTRRDRRIPISSRLRAILGMRRFDPANRPHPEDTHVFGTEIGTRVTDVKRAWATAVLKSHGHTPTYTETANLSSESREALATIDLHFHDLRREAGSRWLDGGVPLHTIRDWLGHTNISQTSTYLAGTASTQHNAMAAFEAHRAALQRIATAGRKRRSGRPRRAATRNKKPNETAVGREASIM
ncbi:MAG: site-specific integrase [Vicinamibacterales bacterium]